MLLILAGVSINAVIGNKGIFKKAEQATEIYSQAKAREILELALSDAQVIKYTEGLTDEQLTERINEVGEELEERETPDISQAIVDGYIFSIDRTVPKILDYIGPADGVIITASVSGNNSWFKQGDIVNITVTGRIKTYRRGKITTVSATKDGIAITGFSIDNNGKYTIDNITANTTIVINAKDSNNKENTKTIPIRIRIDNVAPTLSEVTATAEARRIKIKVDATDNESGLKNINYSVQPTTVNSATGKLTSGQEITLTATTSEEYTIIFTAEDNAGNISGAQIATAETVGVIKHIKLDDGTLKEVNTADIYGSDVLGYTCGRSDAEWQLFYIDEEDDHRVYLIAKDYMAPPTTNASTALKAYGSSYPSGYIFDSSKLENFTGTIPNTEFTRKFLSDYANASTSTIYNLQATNFMLDQTVWAEYMSTNGKSDYAFGGPTLPLFQVSYNDICKRVMKLGIEKNTNGYQINLNGGNFEIYVSSKGNVNTQNGIYFKSFENSMEPASLGAAYLASPSHYPMKNWGGLVYAFKNGQIGSGFNILTGGLRPVVSLKTSAKFTDNGNGTYTIN